MSEEPESRILCEVTRSSNRARLDPGVHASSSKLAAFELAEAKLYLCGPQKCLRENPRGRQRVRGPLVYEALELGIGIIDHCPTTCDLKGGSLPVFHIHLLDFGTLPKIGCPLCTTASRFLGRACPYASETELKRLAREAASYMYYLQSAYTEG
eukprot:scaffold50789_cov21-Prasinocladus_malaysianus.AAC.3